MCLPSAAGRLRVAGSRGWRAAEEGAGWGRGASSEPQPGAGAPPREPSRRPSSRPPGGLARPCGEGPRPARAGRPVAATVSCFSFPRLERRLPRRGAEGLWPGLRSWRWRRLPPLSSPSLLPPPSRSLSARAEDRLQCTRGGTGGPACSACTHRQGGLGKGRTLASPLGHFGNL